MFHNLGEPLVLGYLRNNLLCNLKRGSKTYLKQLKKGSSDSIGSIGRVLVLDGCCAKSGSLIFDPSIYSYKILPELVTTKHNFAFLSIVPLAKKLKR